MSDRGNLEEPLLGAVAVEEHGQSGPDEFLLSGEALFGPQHRMAAIADAAAADILIRKKVLEVIVPELCDAYRSDVSYTAGGLLWFRRWADFLEILAIVLSGVGSTFAYLAGIQGNKWWAFVSGVLGTLSFGIVIIGRYCNAQSKERTQQLNKLLSRFYVPCYPDVVVDFNADSGNNNGPQGNAPQGNAPQGNTPDSKSNGSEAGTSFKRS